MKREFIFVSVVSTLICAIFFYPIFKGYFPYPGDLLVGQYEPYKSDSHLGYAPGGVTHKAQGADVIRQLYPWKYFSIEQLRNGIIPFWNPYSFSGNPHLANFQSSPFYIGNLIFFIFPFIIGWTIYIILQPFLSLVFTFLFLRELKINQSGALFGGISFAFSSFMVNWMNWGVLGHSLLYLPIALLLALKLTKKFNILIFISLVLVLFFSILGGYIQLTIYVYLAVYSFIAYNFILEKSKKISLIKYINIVLAGVFGLLLTSFQLLPTIEFINLSLRAPYTFDQLSERLIPVINLITIAIPDFFGNPATRNYYLSGTYIERASYIGILPLLFAFFTIHAKKIPYLKFFLFSSLLIYISTLDVLPMKLLHSVGIPFLSTGVPSRILSIFCFFLSILAGIGFHIWIEEKDKKKFLKPIIVLFLIIIFAWITTFVINDPNLLISRRNLILPTALFITGSALLSQTRLKTHVTILVIFALTIFDLFYSFHKITPFSPKEFLYPKTDVINKLNEIQGIDRYWGYGSANIEANLQLYEKNFSPEGYDALHIKRYGELISSSNNGKLESDIPRAVSNVAPGYGKEELKKNKYRQKILNILGIKYVLNKVNKNEVQIPDYETFKDGSYKLIWYKNIWQIYENKEVLKRAFLASDYAVEREKDKIIGLLHSDNFQINGKIILEENLQEGLDLKKDTNSIVKLVKYDPNTIILRTSSSSDSLLFLSDNYYPGWKAEVDGKAEKIYRANYSFRAVPVKKGEHEVVFSYYSQSFNLGFKISLITILVIMVYLIGSKLVYRNG